jgi:flavin-dependent dehydrogenase
LFHRQPQRRNRRRQAVKYYDALVIGGGPAGATAGRMLAQRGWRVAVVEKAAYPRRKVCGEFVSAVSLSLLRKAGLAGAFIARAGPPVRRVGLYAGPTMIDAAMPQPAAASELFGRALGREHLDILMLDAAKDCGAELWQPWTLTELKKTAAGFAGTAESRDKCESITLNARIVIAAHGSWEHGLLPTQPPDTPPLAGDLFAFKAHFVNASLPEDLMPLLIFPGGYGGMVHSDSGRMSLSICIRRDMLAHCRRLRIGSKAADAILAHIRGTCRGVDSALRGAAPAGTWLSTGPIRPGIRPFRDDGIFTVGNAAGEAHPIIAEGIGMAMQSAWLLCERLIAHTPKDLKTRHIAAVARGYAADWQRNFSHRVRMAAIFARLATQSFSADITVALLRRYPALLTLGARLSGKTHAMREGAPAGGMRLSK